MGAAWLVMTMLVSAEGDVAASPEYFDGDGLPRLELSERELAWLLMPKLVAKRARLLDEARPSLGLPVTMMALSVGGGVLGGLSFGMFASSGGYGGPYLASALVGLALHLACGIIGAALLPRIIRVRAKADTKQTEVDPLISELERKFPDLWGNAPAQRPPLPMPGCEGSMIRELR